MSGQNERRRRAIENLICSYAQNAQRSLNTKLSYILTKINAIIEQNKADANRNWNDDV